jgi:hypothetical protein
MLHVGQADLGSAAGTSLDNLRSHTQRASYVVLYYDDFRTAADTLAAWRRAHNGFTTKTVPISAIYDQFSGGRTDPTAIRNFLHAAYANWRCRPCTSRSLAMRPTISRTSPARRSRASPAARCRATRTAYDVQSSHQFTTDDWLLNVDNPTTIVPDFLGGRLPVTDAALALNVVRDKVLPYDRAAPFGTYRGRVMLIADDNEQGSARRPSALAHLSQTTDLDTATTPSTLDRDYVYLHTYPDGRETRSPPPRRTSSRTSRARA